MQNKTNKNQTEKNDEDSNENNCDDDLKKDYCSKNTAHLNQVENDKLIQNMEKKTSEEEKSNDEKRKKKKQKKTTNENKEHTEESAHITRDKNYIKEKHSMNDVEFLKQRKMNGELTGQCMSSLEKKFNDVGMSTPRQDSFAKSNPMVQQSNWTSSTSKNAFSAPMTPNSIDADGRSLTTSNHSSSPSNKSPSPWGSEIHDPNQIRFSRLSQEVNMISKRGSRGSITDAYRDHYDPHHYATFEEYPRVDSARDLNSFSQTYSQRNHPMSSYSPNSLPHSSYRSSYTGLDKPFPARTLNNKIGIHGYDSNSRYLTPNMSSMSSSSTEAASVMAAVYMNNRNPPSHYPPHTPYNSNPSNQFPCRIQPTYETTQQSNYGSDLPSYC